MIRALCLYSILLLIGDLTAWADESEIHPRVAEMEAFFSHEASNYIKNRFPDRPFFVTTSVTPLRRSTTTTAGEEIPYSSVTIDEIQDEWDDPQYSMQQLLQRVRKVTLNITLSANASDDEVEELKRALTSFLHLIPVRDEITIARKNWSQSSTNWTAIVALTCTLLTLFILGIYAVGIRTSEKIARALKEAGNSSPHSMPESVTPSSYVSAAIHEKNKNPEDHTGLNLSDPIRMRELTQNLIQTITNYPSFPMFQDILILDVLGRKNPSLLGAIMIQLSSEIQQKIFSICASEHWIEAFHKPGRLSVELLSVLEEITRIRREDVAVEWESLLIACWRLDKDLHDLLKKIDRDEAFSILSHFPKSISIGFARRAFPGNWGSLMETDFTPKPIGFKRIIEITQLAYQIKPLYDYSNLVRHRSELDLVDYLRTADIVEEREIYGAASKDSIVHKTRIPFFPVFDQDQSILSKLVSKFSIDSWSLALLNVSTIEKNKVEVHMTEKQRYLVNEKLKNFEVTPPDANQVGQVRESMAKYLDALTHSQQKDVGHEQQSA